MARKTVTINPRPRRKLSAFADDFPSTKTQEGSGRAIMKPPTPVELGEPSGGPLAKRSGTEVSTRMGNKLPAGGSGGLGDVDFKEWWKQAPENVKGIGSRAAAKLLGGAALAAYSPDVSEGSDRPRDYPGEGLSPVGPPRPVETSAPKVTKPEPKVTKPEPKVAKNGDSAEYDDWLADLRGSAARMKTETSRMAEKTGEAKDKMSEFSQSFKKGGSVKCRRDGIAQRGKTKGRFV